MTDNNNEGSNWDDSLLEGENADYLEMLYEQFQDSPNSLDIKWRTYFAKLEEESQATPKHSHIRKQFRSNGLFQHANSSICLSPDILEDERHQVRVLQLIESFRFLGHLSAHTNPLMTQEQVQRRSELTLEHHQLDKVDQDKLFHLGTFNLLDPPSLKNIYHALKRTYTQHIGVEYMHVMSMTEREWIQRRLELCQSKASFTTQQKQNILRKLIAAENFEQYLHKRYIGQKRFSLEGGESLIPLLDELIQKGGNDGVHKIVIGMAHRGRLNVLINIMGKPTQDLFDEFAGELDDPTQMGDVKYHKGYASHVETPGGSVHLALAFNPSHLEIVSPVIVGSVRAGQTRRGDTKGDKTIAVVLHGDAAFAGQGVVMETFNMSQTRGYGINGTIHIVINNQIGFTTSTLQDSRSSYYATDVAKMVNAPILHVNGDDPEAVILAAQVALDYRLRFSKDVVIDLVCYRRHGHNEADEPAVTQPMMYQTIKALATTKEKYAKKLLDQCIVNEEWLDHEAAAYRTKLDKGEATVKCTNQSPIPPKYRIDWTQYLGVHWNYPTDTQVTLATLQAQAKRTLALPKDFILHDRITKIWQQRHEMLEMHRKVDWGFAETLAYASLLEQGYHLRLSGQDSGRGTFFHRHAVLHNQQDAKTHIPLQHLSPNQGRCEIIDSLLSEEAVLAFEYGYATTDPNTLVIWEAQFGDFANNAQVVIDQFISAGEQKWSRLCGLVMFLPHGLEGMGAEHSSARLERFMQLTAQHNFQVCVPTTPAQIFHLLRRQMIRPYRKPLVVMTPKSLLRHPHASNHLSELAEGKFQLIIDDETVNKAQVKRVILCCGKVYYDLDNARREHKIRDIAIIRIEQLYPFSNQAFLDVLTFYTNAEELVWCQEEARNQGAWDSIKHHFREYDDLSISCISRPTAAAPAVGSYKNHQREQQQLIEKTLLLSQSKQNNGE